MKTSLFSECATPTQTAIDLAHYHKLQFGEVHLFIEDRWICFQIETITKATQK